MNLLLLSNSTIPGQPYLDWPKSLIERFLPKGAETLFIPYAAVTFSYDEYEKMVGDALAEIGIKVRSIHTFDDPVAAIQKADAILVGGGNTFKLLSELYAKGLVEPIRKTVTNGTPYIGWSAGSNVACQSIKTTNDMPIVEPASFDGLQLVNLQINPHYTELTIKGHGGESRLQRLLEYSAVNDTPVLCLPEGCALQIENDDWSLISSEPCKLIRKGGQVVTVHHGPMQL
ncbi:MAG: dipeptidase PepE [Cryomorphaceae bacterium]